MGLSGSGINEENHIVSGSWIFGFRLAPCLQCNTTQTNGCPHPFPLQLFWSGEHPISWFSFLDMRQQMML